MLRKLLPERFELLKTFSFTILFFGFLVRTSLYFLSIEHIDFSVLNLIKIYIIGLMYDIGGLTYVLGLYSIYLLLLPTKFHGKTFDRFITKFTYGLFLFVFIFSFLAEIPFWQEYQRRYNFIAVDYLLYTYEVVENIHQSFPLPFLISIIIAVLALSIRFASKKNGYKITFKNRDSFRLKLIPTIIIFFVLGVFHYNINSVDAEIFNNVNENELAKSGLYSFFAAYKSNELNYNDFYQTLPQEKVYTTLRKNITTKNDSLSLRGYNIKRITKNDSVELRPNIVFIGLESVNARFLKYFGSKENLAPTIDSLMLKSISFSNIYATGTRTIRGMEAISMAIPPTPGRSIVKRKNNDNLFTIGEIFKQKGYSRTFIYGGDGHFDNMTNFFSFNGFDIVDRRKLHRVQKKLPTKRSRIEDNEMTFENAWAVCDEDLFKKTLNVIDKQHKTGKPFFNFIMTSSNHKPYTYPDNVIDIPSGTDILGSLKYLDESLRRFLDKAKTKPWFKNTVFVIMSDHCAFSAGRTEINVENHHIPAMIYNLAGKKPKQVNKLASQIDIFPTLFGYLNWSYETNFYGKDISKMHPKDERAFIGNHRKVGLLKKDRLLILEIPKKHTFYLWNKKANTLKPRETNNLFLEETISYYQSAFELFKNEKLKLSNHKK